jgi:hypothetical protein
MVLPIMIGLSTNLHSPQAQAASCALPPQHAGVAFPVDQVGGQWPCRLQPIINNYTTANKTGPIRTPLPETIYVYLLDHPPMAAALVNRLDLGLYQASARKPGRFWVTDGEGTEGEVESVYQDRATRIYYLEGSHNGTFLPKVTGKAVVLLRMRPVKDPQGTETVETTLVSYIQLDNAFLSGLLSLLRPLIGKVVTRQLMKGFDAAHRLSQVMLREPDRVLFEATDPPGLPDDEVAFLKQALATLHDADGSIPVKTTAP